jgi:predicted nucleic acid-binding protein
LKTFKCLDEPPKIVELWRDLVVAHRVMGKPSHDARLVALMRSHQIDRLVTINSSDFKRYAEIECLVPEQIVTLP